MSCTNWRDVEERLSWMLNHPPGQSGMCARECWQALGGDLPKPCPPAWGTPDANAVYDKVLASGRYWRGEMIPRGALIVWKYGEHGHAALSAGLGRILTTDPSGRPGGTGFESLGYPERWGATPARRIWTDQYNGVRFSIGAEAVAITKPPAYRNIKVETPQKIKLNTWVTIDLGKVDAFLPPVGSDDWWVQVHLSLESLTGAARNDLRYIKGRWVRELPSGEDDTHGTDTKAISLDLPRDSWQSAWSTDMKGLTGVPVSFAVYIGSMKDGTVVSPMRLFTIDDEET